MQFIIFLVLVSVLSLPHFSFPNALLYAVSSLLVLILSQMAVAAVILVITSLYLKINNKSIASESASFYRKEKILTRWLPHIVVSSIILIASYNISAYLLIPAISGILFYLGWEFMNEKYYKKLLGKTS